MNHRVLEEDQVHGGTADGVVVALHVATQLAREYLQSWNLEMEQR